jgi:glycosyltransferase involved in cell wall biosynthesis
MTKVCIIRHRDYGELGLRREAEALRDDGHEVHVICMREPGAGAPGVVDGVHVHALALSRRRGSTLRYVVDYLAFLVATTVLLTLLHLRGRFSVVQVNTMPDFLVACTVPVKLLGAKVIVFMKEPTPELGEMKYGPGKWPRVLQMIEQAAIRYSDLVLTVTEELKQTYVRRGADPDKIRVVLNGPGAAQLTPPEAVGPVAASDGENPPDIPGQPIAQADEGSGLPDGHTDRDTFTLLCHGAVEERYGHDTILRAVALARHELPGLRFRVTGEGARFAELRRLTRQLGLEQHVDLLGWVSLEELTHELAGADVGIVAQRSSPYSNLVHTNKMYEYILFGKPVIATRLESVSAYFPPDSICYVEPDDAESMAAAIVELARNPDLRERFVRNSRALYEEYGWDRQAELFLDAHRAVMSS